MTTLLQLPTMDAKMQAKRGLLGHCDVKRMGSKVPLPRLVKGNSPSHGEQINIYTRLPRRPRTTLKEVDASAFSESGKEGKVRVLKRAMHQHPAQHKNRKEELKDFRPLIISVGSRGGPRRKSTIRIENKCKSPGSEGEKGNEQGRRQQKGKKN